MANYYDNGRSFINGLSDFWLLYFKEIDQLKTLYSGVEIQAGQSYLDLMGLLLNNSVMDTPIFNKEYWKLLQVKETDIRFQAGTTAADNRYVYVLPDNVALARHLNNKILNVTANLDKDVEFYVNDETRAIEFKFDPLNAYFERTYGEGNSAFRVKSRAPGATNIRVWLDDAGVPLSVTRLGYDIHIQYDGPAHTGTTRTQEIVTRLNTQVDTAGLVFVELAGLGTGTAAPAGTTSYVALLRVAVSPLDNFATRVVEQSFGAKFKCQSVTDWAIEGVEKGDVLRLISGPTVGKPLEFEINTVRRDALYVDADKTISAVSGDRVHFAVLRAPKNNTSVREPLVQSGQVIQTGIDGVVAAATRTFSAPSAVFNSVHDGAIIELLGTHNTGYAKIVDVINAQTVTLAATALTDETPVSWSLLSVCDLANTGNDGTLTAIDEHNATFQSPTASFTTAAIGTVLKVHRAGHAETYQITGYVAANEIKVATARLAANGSGLSWGWARYVSAPTTLLYSPPMAWPIEGSIAVAARRLLDGTAVQEGVDYTVDPDTGTLTPKTVWETSVSNTATYAYRQAVVQSHAALQVGTSGTLTVGTTSTFTDPTAVFTPAHVGCALRVLNSGLTAPTNNGIYTIAEVVSSTTVVLTPDKRGVATPDPNNGSLHWHLLRRGALQAATTSAPITAAVREIAFWAPDVLVDKFHLYNTYGYLINRYERSSEEYRSLIRGIFQLFMLGPTLERLEAAVNTVAGLPVVRDNGEILLGYSNDAFASGTDGVFRFTDKTFTSASANFTGADVSNYIYVRTGANANKLYKIHTVVDSHTVVLTEDPVSDVSVEWELTATAEHSVITSRTVYKFRRDIPLRPTVMDPANVGVRIFKAFEVLTDVFQVTDYIEDPTWWEFAQIPRELMPSESTSRRQVSPVLFENVISPADDARIGDPGFYIGADTEGHVPARSVLRSGVAGTLVGDIAYPVTNNVFFDAAGGNFTALDVGNFIRVGGQDYRIVAVVTPTRVQVEAFVNVPTTVFPTWEIVSGALPKRYKAAFVILDKVLKYHTFSVRFDIALSEQLSANLIKDLEDLMYEAKPSYTYIIVTPAALFEEILQVAETMDLTPVLGLGGTVGTPFSANVSQLKIGSEWRIGQWFRPLSATSSFSAPAASVVAPLGSPDAGYAHALNRVVVSNTAFTSGGDPIQVADIIMRATGATRTGVAIDVAAGETIITFPTAFVSDTDFMQYVSISGSSLGNDGQYRIGAVLSPTQVRVSPQASISETGLQAEIYTGGSVVGRIAVGPEGDVTFTDLSGRAQFTSSDKGTFIRRTFVGLVTNQVFEINEVTSPTSAKLAVTRRVHPMVTDPNVVATMIGNVLTCAPGDYVFSGDMAYENRRAADPATALRQQYFVTCTTGPNAGAQYRIEKYLGPNQVRLSGGITDPSVQTYITVVEAPTCVSEVADWEHVKEQVEIRTDPADITLDTPPQDTVAAVPYSVYGVRVPLDPTTATFDASAGDTLYSVGMPDPRQYRGKSRTGRDVDLREEPIQITRT